MKILTIFGTRPEIIRLSLIIRALDKCTEQILVHTGQNYDPNLSQLFLDELKVRPLDYHLGVQSSSFGAQAGQILAKTDDLLSQVKPDRLVMLGDTNSGLAVVVAARRGIPVFHLEAGNRCYDNRVPEEVNRRIIDHSSDILLPYTQRSAENLVREGIRRDRIFVVGNPIFEVLQAFSPQIEASDVLARLGLAPRGYFLVTMHRAENVDLPDRLRALVEGLAALGEEHGKPVVVSVHPRTADRIRRLGDMLDTSRLHMEKPFGLFDFVQLEKHALGIVTDSGTVQEEACLFGIPNVTIRDVTERPETLECGSNFLSGCSAERLRVGMKLSLSATRSWRPPAEYLAETTSMTVAKLVLSYNHSTPKP